MSTRIVERHGIRRLIPKCRQYFRPIVPLQYDWHNRKKGANRQGFVHRRGSHYRWAGRPEAASAQLQDVVGKAKSPCRLVYGVASLPRGAPVEREVILGLAG